MAVPLDVRADRVIGLADLVARIERDLDPRSDETLLALAPDLAALAANPTFLGEHVARELASPDTFQRGIAYTGRSFVLASGPTFLVRANLWDPLDGDPWGAGEPAELRRQIGMYGLLHDHDFSFITAGYFGPGYETDLYECDPERIEGYVGEEVALRPLGRRTLTAGSLLYFERRRHVHAQGTPAAPSVSLNVFALDPTTPFVSQYYFDDVSRRIVAMTSDPYNGRLLLCDLAASLGVARACAPLAALARRHPSAGLRAGATRALAALSGDDGPAVWRGALDDPHPLVRRQARAALDAGGRAVSAFEAFVAAAERALPTWPEGLDACADALGALAASDALAERVAGELAALAERPARTPAGAASLHCWVLWAGAHGAKLSLVRVAAGAGDDAEYLTDAAAHQLLTAVGPDPLEGDLYEQREAPDPEVMSPAYRLRPRRRVTLRAGDVLSLRARRDVFDFLPCAAARYALVFDGPRAHTQQWVYARETRAPVASLAADPHDARLEAAARLLRVLGHADGAPSVAALAAHEAHFVRWTAVRYTAGLDPARGLALLRAAADDPHPHVRDAARKALARLDG